MSIGQRVYKTIDTVSDFIHTRKHPIAGSITALDSLIIAAGTVIAVLSNNP